MSNILSLWNYKLSNNMNALWSTVKGFLKSKMPIAGEDIEQQEHALIK